MGARAVGKSWPQFGDIARARAKSRVEVLRTRDEPRRFIERIQHHVQKFSRNGCSGCTLLEFVVPLSTETILLANGDTKSGDITVWAC